LHSDNQPGIFVWVPRVLAILFILFLSAFAFDSFAGESPFHLKIAGFLIHLIPSFFLAVNLFFAWKNPRYGGIFFIIFGLVFTIFLRTYNSFSFFMLLSFPLFAIGALFMIYHSIEHKKETKN